MLTTSRRGSSISPTGKPSNNPLQQSNARGPLEGWLPPRRRGRCPRLLPGVVRSKATLASAAERQIVGRTGRRTGDEAPS